MFAILKITPNVVNVLHTSCSSLPLELFPKASILRSKISHCLGFYHKAKQILFFYSTHRLETVADGRYLSTPFANPSKMDSCSPIKLIVSSAPVIGSDCVRNISSLLVRLYAAHFNQTFVKFGDLRHCSCYAHIK